MLRTLVLCSLVAAVLGAIRVDQERGFKFCNIPQFSQLVSVEVDGPGCKKWPCLLFPGRSGAFKITLYNQQDTPIYHLVTDIHATLRLNGVGALTGRQRVAMPGEVKKPACPFTSPGCPVMPQHYFGITKIITVPSQARMAYGTMQVEFKVRDGRGRVLTCFTAPVIIG